MRRLAISAAMIAASVVAAQAQYRSCEPWPFCEYQRPDVDALQQQTVQPDGFGGYRVCRGASCTNYQSDGFGGYQGVPNNMNN